MSAAEWLLWFALCWAVFLAYCAFDAPTLCGRAAHRLSDQIRHGGTR